MPSIIWSTLLVGKVPFGKHNRKHVPLHSRELEARKVASYEETNGVGIGLLIKMVKSHEHPDLIKKAPNELSEEENRELKHFSPACLTSEDWDDKNLDVTLKNIEKHLLHVDALNH